MKTFKFVVVTAVCCLLSFVALATDVVQTSSDGRFIEVTVDGNKVIYAEDAYPPERSLDEAGVWRTQIVFDYNKKQVWLYICDFSKRGEFSACVPKFGDAIVTPDPSSLPKDIVIGMVSRVNTGSGRCLEPDQPDNCII